jgi:hypothetical protein
MSNPSVEVAAAAVLSGNAEDKRHNDGPSKGNPIMAMDRAVSHHRTPSNRISIPERLEVMRTMGWKVGSSRRRDGHFAAYLGRVGRPWNARHLETATAWCVMFYLPTLCALPQRKLPLVCTNLVCVWCNCHVSKIGIQLACAT